MNRTVKAVDVAKDLERRIREDEFAAHERLPTIAALAEEYRTAHNTAHAAVKMLARKGLVTSVRSYGTVVRDWRRPRQVRRKRAVYCDNRGFYFDHIAKEWQATGPSRIDWVAAEGEIAELLGVETGSEVLIRERIVGDEVELAPGRRHVNPQQVATTIVPADIARPLDLGRKDTGPGGVLCRITDWLKEVNEARPDSEPRLTLLFEDVTYARLPSREEAAHLQLGGGDTPVIVTAVVMSDNTGRVLAINNYVMDARRWMIGHPLNQTQAAKAAYKG